MVIDALWIVNIILMFITPHEQEMVFQHRFWDIAKKYIFSNFVFDVLSTLTIFFNYQYKWMYHMKYLRIILYFFRAISIIKRIIDPIVDWCKLSKQARSNVQSIFAQLLFLFTVMHMVACGWILIGQNEEFGTWLDNHVRPNADGSTIYITSLYWVVTTLTTVGYGDIFGTTVEEYLYTMCVEFIGILVFSIIMSTVNTFLSF